MKALKALSMLMLPLLGPIDAEGGAVPDVTLASDAPGVRQVNGVLHHRGEAFSGWVVEKQGGAVLSRTPYFQGKPHGLSKAWYADGSPRYERTYRFGHREGTHRGYWQNGQVQFVYRYQRDLLEGEQVAFYKNGVQSELRHYHDGHEEGLQRFYDGEGRLVANYTFRNGRRYGIVGRVDCISMASD